jgi:hypothetical protein
MQLREGGSGGALQGGDGQDGKMRGVGVWMPGVGAMLGWKLQAERPNKP